MALVQVQVPLRMEPQVKAEMERLDCSKSDLILEALYEYLENHKAETDTFLQSKQQ